MNDRKNITAVILAGGLGTRLKTVVKDQPKVLAEVNGRPFLKYLLDQLANWHIEKIVLCTGYLGDQIETFFGNQYRSAQLVYSKEPEPLGTGGALRFALPLLNSEQVLVLNGDSYCDADFTDLLDWHTVKHSSATVYLCKMHDTSRFGRVQVTGTGEIIKFDEKDGQVTQPGLINAGIYLINRKFLDTIPDKKPCSLEREIFPGWIGQHFFGYRTDSAFLDIGTPESYAAASVFLTKLTEDVN